MNWLRLAKTRTKAGQDKKEILTGAREASETITSRSENKL